MEKLERELDFYRRQCNELGTRVLHLQEEQTRARRETRQSRTTAKLIREGYQLINSNVPMGEIGQRFLQIIVDNLNVDRAAFLKYLPEKRFFVTEHALGFPQAKQLKFKPPNVPGEYYFSNSNSPPDPFLDSLRKAARVPFLLWIFNPQAEVALFLGNETEDQILHRPFEKSDREIVEGGLSVFIDIIERKQAEKKLQESEERYRALYEDNPSMYFTVDAEGIVLSVNQFGSEQLGYTVKELVGQPVLNVFYENDKEAVQQQFAACIQNPQELFHWEFRKVRKDRNIIWVKEAARAVQTVDGNLVVLIVCEDITERKQMEEALRQSEANLKKAQEVGHVGSWHLNLKKNKLIWSDEACRIFGVPQETVLTYEEFLETVHPDDREYVNSAWTAALVKKLYDIEHRIIVNGEVKWVRERAEVELDETAKGVRATGTVEDITDLKRAEEKLRESEERYRSLVESSTDAIMMLDHDENVITCNQAFLDLFGYQKEEIVGKAIRIIHPSDESAQKFRETHYQTLEGTGSVRTEWEYVRKDGTSFPAELVISLISSIEGTIIGCISIIRDITERKQADEKLKASFERLRKSLESTVSALASALEIRDPYTAGHQHRVTDLACAIADEMGLTEEQINGIRMAGLIHDIGKISIPAEILNKPGQLTEIEYTLFKNHPQVAHDVLQTVEFPWPVAQIVLQHHERFDGSGYPQGLAGKEILLESRILAVADIVEAIASHRPYRPARGAGDALEEILHNKGTLYDPEVVDACLRVFYEKGFTFEELAKLEAPLPKIH